MTVNDVLKKIEEFAPPALAYSWDNVGLLIGSGEREVKRVLIALDADLSVAAEAVDKKCDLIVSHHPMMFKGVKRILSDDAQGMAIELLIKNDISVIAAHTNMDCAKGGINDRLAELFKLENVEVLDENPAFPGCGLGRVGDLKEAANIGSLAVDTKMALGIDNVRVSGSPWTRIERIAVAGGSCSEVIPLAIAKGCQAIITGDMKYHETMDAANSGISVIDAGHYGTERNVIGIFEKILEPLGLELVKSDRTDVFVYL